MKPALHFPRIGKTLLAAALVAMLGIAGLPAEAKTPQSSALESAKSKVAAGADAKALQEELEKVLDGSCDNAMADRLEAVRFLLDNGVEVNYGDSTPLTHILQVILLASDDSNCEAVQEENNKIAMLLVSRGADINIDVHNMRYKVVNTAFETAIQFGSANLVQLMIKKGAKVNYGESHWTPLHWAVGAGATDIVKVLLDNGANIDAKNYQGDTPLMLAAEGLFDGADTIVRLLVERGANVNAVNVNGVTALTKATWRRGNINKRNKIIAILKAAGAKEAAGGKKGAKKRK